MAPVTMQPGDEDDSYMVPVEHGMVSDVVTRSGSEEDSVLLAIPADMTEDLRDAIRADLRRIVDGSPTFEKDGTTGEEPSPDVIFSLDPDCPNLVGERRDVVMSYMSRLPDPVATQHRVGLPRGFGQFRIDSVIGIGRFTIVCLATDASSWLARKVVLKIPIRQRFGKEPMENLACEARVWKRLSDRGHPNILRFEDLKTIGLITFFVTEYMDGGNVEDAVARVPDSERVRTVVNWLMQMARGLAFTHEQGVIHGDLKPRNCLVSADLQAVKLADFGLSALQEEASLFGDAVAGTLRFLAPESFDGVRSTQTDIYALGVTIYYLLCGKYPFTSDSQDLSVLRAERIANHPQLRAEGWSIPVWLEELVHRCLEPNPKDRFADGTELLDHVLRCADSAGGQRIILAASCDPESQVVFYDLETRGDRSREMLPVEVTHHTVEGLCGKWDDLGDLALERVGRVQEGADCGELDAEIASLLDSVAENGAQLMLGPRVRETLAKQSAGTLWVLTDPRLTCVPWELLDVGGEYLCRRFPMVRWPRLVRPSKVRPRERATTEIKVLLVADPSGTLSGAKAECEQIRLVLSTSDMRDRLTVDLVDHSTDAFTLRSKMRKCDVLHFAGHALFVDDGGDMHRSGWLVKGDPNEPESADILRAGALADLWSNGAPSVVFANACLSGKGSPETLHRRVYSDASLGLAQAFLAAGVPNYVGTVWNLPDNEMTAGFARSFYRHLFSSGSVGQALFEARQHCAESFGTNELTWARYVLFGDPSSENAFR